MKITDSVATMIRVIKLVVEIFARISTFLECPLRILGRFTWKRLQIEFPINNSNIN